MQMINKEEIEKDILFQIDMQLYDEFNEKFCEINEHLGDVYSYKDLRDIEEAEIEKERNLLRGAITNLQNRIKELEKINKEHQKINGNLQKRITDLENILKGKSIQELGISEIYNDNHIPHID